MDLPKSDIQKALRISRAVQNYIDITNQINLRSTDVFPYLVRQGLFDKDINNGVYFRKFLKKLLKANLLESLIPQCRYVPSMIDGNPFGEWYFNNAKSQMPKVIKVQTVQDTSSNLLKAEMCYDVAEDIVQMILEGINPFSESEIPGHDLCMHPRIQEALHYLVNVNNEIEVDKTAILPMPKSTQIMEGREKEGHEDFIQKIKSEIETWEPKRKEESLSDTQKKVRISYPRAFEFWSNKEKDLLYQAYQKLDDTSLVASMFKRTDASVKMMLEQIANIKNGEVSEKMSATNLGKLIGLSYKDIIDVMTEKGFIQNKNVITLKGKQLGLEYAEKLNKRWIVYPASLVSKIQSN